MFVNNIKKIRESRGLSQEDLARLISVSNKTIHNIETGKTDTTITIAKKIKTALQVESLDELF